MVVSEIQESPCLCFPSTETHTSMPSFMWCRRSNLAPHDFMTRTLLTEPSPPLDRQTAWIFGGIFLLVLVFIIIIPVFCVAHPALPPVAQFSLPAVPFWRCAIPISPPPSLFSCQLLYYSLHVSRTPLFLSSGSAILTGTGRRLHRACSSATNSQTSEPSGKEASLHVTANACFLFLSLQNSFQNSWLPSFR